MRVSTTMESASNPSARKFRSECPQLPENSKWVPVCLRFVTLLVILSLTLLNRFLETVILLALHQSHGRFRIDILPCQDDLQKRNDQQAS